MKETRKQKQISKTITNQKGNVGIGLASDQGRTANGITLIALVITIIVLLILAGVAINLTLGDNGIFKKAKESKEKMVIAEESEIIKLAYTESVTENITEGKEITINNLQEKISKSKTATVEEVSEIPENARVIDNGLSSGTICKITMEYDYYMFIKGDTSKKFYIELYNGEELVDTLKFNFDNTSSFIEWYNNEGNLQLENSGNSELFVGNEYIRSYSFQYDEVSYNIELTVQIGDKLTGEDELFDGKTFKAFHR